MTPEARRHWTRLVTEFVRKQLSTRQREILQATGRLLPAHLTERQKTTMKWLAAVAFVTKAGLSPDATGLKGATLERAAVEIDGKSRHELRFVFPTASGEPRIVARAAWEPG